nr:SMI1/KNR4 family protein [Paenibacillus turicensis]
MEEIEVIEQQYEIKYPELYKQFLRAYHYVELQFKNIKEGSSYKGDCAFIEMPRLLTGEGLSEVINLMENWHPMLLAGYLPFAVGEDGQGPICFDLLNPNEQGDYPVIWVLHDYLHQLDDTQQNGEAIRAFLHPYIREIFPSFEEMARLLIVPMRPNRDNDE